MLQEARSVLLVIGALGLGLAWAVGSSSCDDTPDTSTSTTSTGGDLPFCGDGVIQPELGEECDDANDADFDQCLPTCKKARCGDAFVIADTEECDDANASNSDACTTACLRAQCGDGFVQKGVEACDDGNEEDDDACIGHCVAGDGCGDGVVANGEVCDDGNHSNGDFCTNACVNATCGDGFLEPTTEECDDHDLIDDNACSNTCKLVGSGGPFGCPGVSVPLTLDKPVTLAAKGSMTRHATGSCGGDGPEVVFAVTPDADGLLELDLVPSTPTAGDPPGDPVLHVRSACGDASTEKGCSNRSSAGGPERLEIDATEGQTYFVFADTFGADAKANFALTATLTHYVAGDDCFGIPVPIDVNETKHFTGNTIVARAQRRGLELCNSPNTKEIVYEVRPKQSGTIFAVLAPNYDGTLYVRTSCTDAMSQVLCSEMGAPGATETVTLDVVAGHPYYYFVDGFKGDAGSYAIDFTLSPG
ncbi:MAG: DUF4215 domain-containing protein [Polyangiaceae bacterium]